MDNAPGWLLDPEREDQERYWNGSAWTDRVRPAGKGRPLHLPEHVPELQRALAAATADIDAVEDRLSNLFDRTEGAARPSPPPPVVRPQEPAAEDDEIIDLHGEEDDTPSVDEEAPVHEEFTGGTDEGADTDDADTDDADTDDAGAFAELDAALAAEEAEPEEPKRGFFRRRS
ncbi:MAG TPA: DUF2510 domain-containing protein [Myxococcaceae bacterium]